MTATLLTWRINADSQIHAACQSKVIWFFQDVKSGRPGTEYRQKEVFIYLHVSMIFSLCRVKAV